MAQVKKRLTNPSSFLNNGCKTIGFLTEGLSGDYQAGVWPGIMASARAHNLNVLCFCGGSFSVSSQNPWDAQGNVLYDIAQKHSLDGVIIAGSLGSYISDDLIKKFLARFTHLPAVTLAPTIDSIPAIFVDNRSGMRSLITHLVEDHKYQKVAFIRGPEGNVEAEERFNIFCEVMEGHTIPVNSDWVIPGDFTRNCGGNAVNKLMESKADFEVIIAADDETALGALQALREHGRRVPEDVALVGFDDIEESKYITPPLTTVNQPLVDLGTSAVDMLYKLLGGEKISQNTILEAKLIIRQSCGCFSHVTDKERINNAIIEKGEKISTISEEEVLDYLAPHLKHSYADDTRELIKSFCTDINAKSAVSFLKNVDRIGQELVLKKEDLHALHVIFFELWYFAAEHLDKETFAFTGDLLQQARIICGDLGIREQGVRRIQTVRENYFLHEIGDVLKNTLDKDKLMDAIYTQLPRLGIKSFYVSLYESRKMPSQKSRLQLACVNGKKVNIGKDGIINDTNALLPEEIAPKDSLHILVVEPLYFQKEQFGIIVFEEIVEKYERYEILREYISSALHSALLIKKVQQQAENLSRANTELEKLREKEHAYLQAIKDELELGRTIQRGFLPKELPQLGDWELAVEFMPAREVSGDFYDAFMLDDDLVALVVADVSGKDVSAALFMSLIRTLLRVFSERAQADGDDPLDAIEVVHNYIVQHHRQEEGRCMFATIVFGLLRPSTGEMQYINAGHNAPILVKENTVSRELRPTGPAVGLSGDHTFAQGSVTIEPNELLFMYTDGVTEAQTPKGDFFTVKRLKELLQKEYNSVEDKISQITQALKEHNGEAAPYDDTTILAVKRKL